MKYFIDLFPGGTLGHCLLHLSWVMVVLKRVFSHDAKSVVKLGIISCLEMKLDNSPLLLKENWDVSLLRVC